ncbi:MAG: hypothetical protein HOP28_10900, partial [Gemmatimonadales bacterium]|nr:hypothetical protein [Gemmatimonadales bacterium]
MRPHWSGLALDIRLAARRLRHAPTYATAVVLIFTLGIGATTTLFSIVRGVVLRPLPFPESERLIRICEEHSSIRGFCVASPYSVREWGASSRTLSAIGLGRDWPFSRIRDDGRREQVTGGWASPGLFAALGVRPALGRLLVPNDLAAGANKVVVLSSEFWQSEFGGTPDVLNRRIVLDGENYAILGVLPKGAAVPGLPEVRLWVPIPADPDQEETRRWRGFQV